MYLPFYPKIPFNSTSCRAETSCAVPVVFAMSPVVPMGLGLAIGLASELHPRCTYLCNQCEIISLTLFWCLLYRWDSLSIYRRSKLPLVVSATFTHLSALQSFLILLAYCLSAALSITFPATVVSLWLFRFPLLITVPEPLAMDLLNER